MGQEQPLSELWKTVNGEHRLIVSISASNQHRQSYSVRNNLNSSGERGFDLSASSNNECSRDLLDIGSSAKAVPPHEALFFALAYLRLPDLLMVQRVCRSLRDAVNDDLLLWRDIQVEPPMSAKLTDKALLQLTSKARGELQTLALMECWKITNVGLRQVIDNNPRIVNLFVPGCVRLTPDGVVEAVKALVEREGKLRRLKLQGICNMGKEHLEILYSLLHKNQQQEQTPLVFYGKGARLLPPGRDNGRLIDVEICPQCENTRLVFDCTRESCKERPYQCRGCIFCIARCGECGACVDLQELGETFCFDWLCLECWLRLPKCLLCNRPGCHRHFGLPWVLPGAGGFICEYCSELPCGSPA